MRATLHCRTSVLAIMNPRVPYARAASMDELTGLEGPLLSRFDVILPLPDRRDAEWDEHVADHILKLHRGAPGACQVRL